MKKDLLHCKLRQKVFLAPSTGFEPAAHGVGGHCSIHLSYEGLFLPNKWYYIPHICKSKAHCGRV